MIAMRFRSILTIVFTVLSFEMIFNERRGGGGVLSSQTVVLKVCPCTELQIKVCSASGNEKAL